MKTMSAVLFFSVWISALLAQPAPAAGLNTAKSAAPPAATAPATTPMQMSTVDNSWRNDPRIAYYENQVHLSADQLRGRAKELAEWQKRNWVAPRACSGSKLSWAKTPAGKPAALYDCTPFQCQGDGLCSQACSTDSNCAPGAKCLDADAAGRGGVCVTP